MNSKNKQTELNKQKILNVACTLKTLHEMHGGNYKTAMDNIKWVSLASGIKDIEKTKEIIEYLKSTRICMSNLTRWTQSYGIVLNENIN